MHSVMPTNDQAEGCVLRTTPHPLHVELERIASLAKQDWLSLTDATILLTGGTGFFGTWLVHAFSYANRLFDLKASLHVLSRNPARFLGEHPRIAQDPSIRFLTGDVRSFTIDDVPLTHVIHGAAATSGPVAEGDPEEMYSVIADGTHHVLKLCRKREIRRCLLLSSGAVYGRQPSDLSHVPEHWMGGPDQTDSRAAYAEGKRAAELLAAIYSAQSRVEVPIARCFAFVGPYLPLDAHFAIGNFIGDVLRGRDVVVKSDGTTRRSYMHAADLVVWLLAILARGTAGRPYNVGSDQDVSVREAAEAVIQAAQLLWPRRQTGRLLVQTPPAHGRTVSRYVPNCDRAKHELALLPIIPLPEAIRMTLRFYAEIPTAYSFTER